MHKTLYSSVFRLSILSATLFILASCDVGGSEVCNPLEVYSMEMWSVGTDGENPTVEFDRWPATINRLTWSIFGVLEEEKRLYISLQQSNRLGVFFWDTRSDALLPVESFGLQASLSPDGNRIAFNRFAEDTQIWLTNASGQNPTRLIDDSSLIETKNPVWLGDSRRVYFSAEFQNERGMYLLDTQTGTRTQLLTTQLQPGDSDISMDGSILAWVNANRLLNLRVEGSDMSVPVQSGSVKGAIQLSDNGEILQFVDAAGNLIRYNTETGDYEVIANGVERLSSVALSPDGLYSTYETASGLFLYDAQTDNTISLATRDQLIRVPDDWDEVEPEVLTPVFTNDDDKIYFLVRRFNSRTC
ncbi:MAG: hypothetical protein LAT67_07255 [Balneolales bacterium]|nr:hypothetical protein [Balneolales bacterium]